MKTNLLDYLKWIGYAVLGGIIIALFFMWNGKRKEVIRIQALYESCLNAPADTVTIHDSIVIYKSQPYKPKPLRHETRLEVPPVPVDTGGVLCEEEYRDTYTYQKQGDFGRFVWKAKIRNCEIMEMDFSEIVFPKQIVTITRKVDTCLSKPPEELLRNYFWLYVKPQMIIYPFKVSGVKAGVQWTIKNKWGIGGGIGYDWTYGDPTAEVVFLFNLNSVRKEYWKKKK